MDKLATALGGLLFIGLFLFLACIFGALVGAFSAIVMAWLFPDTMAILTTKFGFPTAWQLGVAVGWLSGFFAARNTSTKSS